MKAQDIVDQLARVVPLYTEGFSNSVGVTSATLAGTVLTVQTDAAHGLTDGQAVSVSGLSAPVQIDAGTFLRTGSSAVFETVQDHDLTLSARDKAAGGKSIKISGASEAEFNGGFTLTGVLSRNKLVIAVDDSGPTTISGSPVVEDANGAFFSGLFPATVTGADTFTYDVGVPYGLDPFIGAGASVQVSLRILAVLDIEQYLADVYTRKSLGDDVLVVQLGDVTQSKNRNEQSDAATSSSGEYAFSGTLIQPFAVYIIQNVTDDLTGADARDKVEGEYVPALFRALVRTSFSTGFSYQGYQATFTGHGVFAYSSNLGKNKAIYAHEVTFEQLVQITKADTADNATSVALRDIGYTLTTDLGTGELTANVNLDEDAEPEP